MGGRTSNKVSPMKEYGRKPYLVTKQTVPLGEEADYRYMMDKTWQKAQDDAHIVVQSVKKKPYQGQDYQMMENAADGFTNITWHFNGNWYWPKLNWRFGQTNTVEPVPPIDPDRNETRRLDGTLRWIQCPTTVSTSKSYTVIVRNSYTITRQYTNERLRSSQTTTTSSEIYLVPKTPEAKGLSITYVKDMGDSTRATLQTTSYATGEFYIYATDGKNTIKGIISASATTHEYTFDPPTKTVYYDDVLRYSAGELTIDFADSVSGSNAAAVVVIPAVGLSGNQDIYYDYNGAEAWHVVVGLPTEAFDNADIYRSGNDIVGDIWTSGGVSRHWTVLNDTVTLV
jgi:hypothetical protein